MSAAEKDSGIVRIHGKEYLTVGKRISDLRAEHPDYQIETEILSHGELVLVKATIRDSEGKLIATGHAEEDRNMGKINSTSALENAETSAVGRALAFLGKGGTEIASADEVAGAINQQGVKEAQQKAAACMQAYQRHADTVDIIKDALAQEDYTTAKQAFSEIPDDDKHAMWLAPTKGGCWTAKEYQAFKSNEWSAA